MQIGQRAELFRWRELCDCMFSKVISAGGEAHEQQTVETGRPWTATIILAGIAATVLTGGEA